MTQLPRDFKEFLQLLNSKEFETCYNQRVTDVVDGVEINFINLDDLKANKRASGRPKDVNDLHNLP